MAQPTWGLRRFEYLSFLGRGGMGSVYEVFDRELGGRVALKTVGLVDGQALLRFKREFRSVRELHHTNIVRLFELLEFEGEWGYTMELVHGLDFVRYVLGSPARRVASSRGRSSRHAESGVDEHSGEVPAFGKLEHEEGRFPERSEERLRKAVLQLAEALVFIHGQGHVHRDVKPSNVLVTREGRAVLLDFGLVKERHEERQHTDVKAVGTALYMAPEQAAGELVGPAADWYALGVVLYEAMTGRVPFDGQPVRVMLQKQREQPDPPTRWCAGLPQDLTALCMGLLQPMPADRPSAGEVIATLRAQAPADLPRTASLRPAHASSVFLGRESELSALARSFVDAQNKRPRSLLLHGPSGIGKTSLAEHFAESVSAEAGTRVTVLRGRCRQYEEVSFKAFDELFDTLSGLLAGNAELEGLRAEHAVALRRAFPVLERVPALSTSRRLDSELADPKQLRIALYGGVRRLLRALSNAHDLIVVLEDMHWADADSWALLHEVLREPDPPPMMLIMTARSELLSSTTDPESDAHQVLFSSELESVALLPFAAIDAKTLVAQLLTRGTPNESLIAHIVSEAQGHPLFLAAMARHVRSRGGHEAFHWADVVWGQIASLPEHARDVLVAISLMGGPGARRVLAEALSLDSQVLSERVDLLLARRLLRGAGTGASAVEPQHDQIRQAVLERIPEDERVLWHGRIARAIETKSDTPDDAVLHYFRAGDLGAAASCALRAADRAISELAFDRAVRMVRQSLEWTSDEPTRQKLTLKLAEALSSAGLSLEAAEAYIEAEKQAPARESLELRRTAAVHLLAAGEIERGKALLSVVLGELGIEMPRTPLGALGKMLLYRARLWLRGTNHEIDPEIRLPVELRTRLELCGSIAFILSSVDPFLGGCFGTLYTLLALPTGDREHTARALHIEASYLGLVGNQKRGALLGAQARLIAGSSPSPYLSALMAANDSAVQWVHSDYRAALRSARTAHQEFSARCQRVSFELVMLELVETNSLFWLGRYPELARRAAVCLRASEERGDRYGVTNMLVSQASVRFLVDDRPDEARASIERGLTGWNGQGFDMRHLMALQCRAYVCLYDDLPEQALALFQASAAAMARSMVIRLPAYRVLGWYLEAQIRLAVAEKCGRQHSHDELSKVHKLERKLAKAKVPLGSALASCVSAALCGHVTDNLDLGRVHRALTELERLGLEGHAAALKLRVAARLDKSASEASKLRSEALRFMTRQGVKRPELLATVLCPSLGQRSDTRALTTDGIASAG